MSDAPTFSARYSESGEYVIVTADSPIVSVGTNDDIQSVAVSGRAQGGAFSLTLPDGSQARATVSVVPPPGSICWTMKGLTPGVPVHVQASRYDQRGDSPSVLFEVFDGPDASHPPLASRSLDQSHAGSYGAGDYTAGLDAGGVPVPSASWPSQAFVNIAAPTVTPAGDSLTVRMSSGGIATCRAIRVAPSSGTARDALGRDPLDHASYYLTAARAVTSGQIVLADDFGIALIGQGAGESYKVQIPLPPDFEATGTNPVLVHAKGARSGLPQAAMTASDPAVTISRVNVGGGGPHLGGAALGVPIWTPGCRDILYDVPTGMAGAPARFTSGPGFASTASGPAAATDLAVSPPGPMLPPRLPGRKRFRTGKNITGDYYGSAGRIYADLAKGSSLVESPNILEADADGYPRRVSSGFLINVCDLGTDYGGEGKGIGIGTRGRHRIVFDGSRQTFGPFPQVSTTTMTVVSTSVGKATGNEIVIDIQDPVNFGPAWGLNLLPTGPARPDGTFDTDLANLRIIPPDPADRTGATPWASPEKYHPSLRVQAGRAEWWRWMDGGAINNSNARTRSDLTAYSRVGYPYPTRATVADVVRVSAYTGTDRFVRTMGSTPVVVETRAPHRFSDGDAVSMGQGVGAIETTTGRFGLSLGVSIVRVLSPTSFVFGAFAGGDSSAMIGVLTPSGPGATATVSVMGGGIPWDDCGGISAYLGAGLWRNIPHLMGLDEVSKIAAVDAATIPHGAKVLVEDSNEVWNDSFVQRSYYSAMSRTLLGCPGAYDHLPYQVWRSVMVHRAYVAGWVAAGRSASDVVRFIGSSPGANGTAAILALCKGPWTYSSGRSDCTVDMAGGTTTVVTTAPDGSKSTATTTFPGLGAFSIDAVGPSLYIDNDPFPGLPAAGLTLGKALDLFKCLVAGGSIGRDLAQHKAAISAAGLPYPVSLAAYEFNVQSMIPGGQAPGGDPLSVAVHRHPDMGDIFWAILQQCEDAGVDFGNVYYMNGGNYMAQWDVFDGLWQVPGTGREPGSTNRSAPGNIPGNVSVIGGALDAWNASGDAPPAAPGRATGVRLVVGAWTAYVGQGVNYVVHLVGGNVLEQPLTYSISGVRSRPIVGTIASGSDPVVGSFVVQSQGLMRPSISITSGGNPGMTVVSPPAPLPARAAPVLSV